MAMSSVIRKITCHTINVPLSLRAIATPRRIFTGSVTKSLISGEKQRLVHRRESFVISNQYFSTLRDVKKVVAGTLRDVKKLVVALRDVPKIASYFMMPFDQKVHDFLNWESESDRRLKPAIHLPQPPVDFHFKIHDTLGEDGIKLTREFPRENILVKAMCKVDVHQSTDSSDSSFFRNFLPTDYSDYKDFRELHIAFTVTKLESNAPGIICDGTQIRLIILGNRVKFSKLMDSDGRKYWGEVLPILGFDEALIRFLIVYMVRRNKLNRLPRLNNVSALVSTI